VSEQRVFRAITHHSPLATHTYLKISILHLYAELYPQIHVKLYARLQILLYFWFEQKQTLMLIKKHLLYIILVTYFIGNSVKGIAQIADINNNTSEEKVVFGNDRIKMTLDYNQKATVSSLIINGSK
jgi:hypothetical protein